MGGLPQKNELVFSPAHVLRAERVSVPRWRGAPLLLDLIDRRNHRVKREQRGGVACFVVAHRLEHRNVRPATTAWRVAVLLEHPADTLAQRAQFGGGRADHIACYDRGRRLAERAGLYLMGEVGDRVALHLEIDGNGGAAQL